LIFGPQKREFLCVPLKLSLCSSPPLFLPKGPLSFLAPSILAKPSTSPSNFLSSAPCGHGWYLAFAGESVHAGSDFRNLYSSFPSANSFSPFPTPPPNSTTTCLFVRSLRERSFFTRTLRHHVLSLTSVASLYPPHSSIRFLSAHGPKKFLLGT